MSLSDDGGKPVIKACGDDERESDLPASQKASQDQSPDIHHSSDLCPQNDTAAANANRSDILADVDFETPERAKESLNMETENDASDISCKNASKSELLKVPYFDSDKNGFDNQAFCTDLSQKHEKDANTGSSIDGNRIQGSKEITGIEENKCTTCSDLCKGNRCHKNGFAASSGKEEDNARDYEKDKEFISIDDKKMFNEGDLKKRVSYQPLNYVESSKGISRSQTVNTNKVSQKDLSQEKPVEKVKEENKSKEKETMSNAEMDTTETDEDTICGIGWFRPKWLQKWATPRCYLILYSIVGVFQGGYYAYLIGTISTLEKRFAFKSKISGVIMIIDEITPLILGIFVGYFGGRAHRPRMVAFGMLLSTLCCFFSAMPFFIYGPAQHLVYSNSTSPDVCDFQQKREECDGDDRPPTLAAVVFLILGSFLKGFGNLAYYAIGLSYMDDNAEKKNTPMYFGVSFALRLLGPTSGFLMSSAFLKIYENPFKDPGFDREDPRWIGAWWMGFVLQGVLLLIFTFPIMLFPRRLPKQRKTAPHIESSFENESITQKIKGLIAGLKRLANNQLYVYLGMETVLSILGGFGHYMMLPKYMENQFRLSASDASLYSGPPGLVALQISTVLGSIVIWKYRLSARALMVGKITTETVGVILFLVMMIPSCPNINFAGSTSVNILGKGVELENQCNEDCLCTTNVFTPLCGPDGVSTYFSSCHAGCSVALPKGIHGPEVFGNCSCVHGENGSFITVEKMEKGFCPDEDCWIQAKFYITLLPIMDGITSIFRVGHTMILLRSVDPQDKSFALGTFETIICLFGFIPYPVIFGALADSVCLVWEFSCGVTGNCWVYDMQKFNFLLHGVCASFCFAATLCDIRVLSLSNKIRDLYKEEDDNDDEEKQEKTVKKLYESTLKDKFQESVECTRL